MIAAAEEDDGYYLLSCGIEQFWRLYWKGCERERVLTAHYRLPTLDWPCTVPRRVRLQYRMTYGPLYPTAHTIKIQQWNITQPTTRIFWFVISEKPHFHHSAVCLHKPVALVNCPRGLFIDKSSPGIIIYPAHWKVSCGLNDQYNKHRPLFSFFSLSLIAGQSMGLDIGGRFPIVVLLVYHLEKTRSKSINMPNSL
jgi:hypothetical protein